MKRDNTGTPRAARQSRRPRMERLEERTVPSTIPKVIHDPIDGVLRIEGTAHNDTVHVRYDAAHRVVVDVSSSGLPPGSALLPVRVRGWVREVRMFGYGGNDYLRSDLTNVTMRATGGDGNDILFGGSGQDVLFGDAGNDTLHGWTGNDLLFGGAGNDALFGQSGNDQLFGGEGSDVLRGDAGNDLLCGGNRGWDAPWEYDHLYGGSGADTFLLAFNYYPGRQRLFPDRIADFGPGDAVGYNLVYLPF